MGRRIAIPFLGILAAATLGQISPASAQTNGVANLACEVFQAPARNQRRMAAQLPLVPLFQKGRYGEAEMLLNELSVKFPRWADVDYNLAAAQARQGRRSEALDNLAVAVEKGFAKLALMERDPDFEALRGNDRFTLLLASTRANAEARKAALTPGQVSDGSAFVTAGNTRFVDTQNRLFTYFKFPQTAPSGIVRNNEDQVARILNGWIKAGKAAGNHGDLYDNRDRGHSRLSKKVWPQITQIEYSSCARGANIDYGLNTHIIFNAITFGNSSTAVNSGKLWRSLPRLALTTPKAVLDTVLQAANNHLYVYPAVMDFGPKNGDMLPINTPYLLISKGKSGSDRPILEAVSAILAAFRPRVKNALRSARMINPTVQMIFRRGLTGVETDDDYLSAKAHPTAFDGARVNLRKMIFLANALALDEVPPVVRLAVIEESQPKPGVDIFTPANIGETFLNTPGAIGRIMRGTGGTKRMVVSAQATADPNGRPLSFRWSVLSGDAARITIRPLDKNGTRAEIIIPWHERRPSPGAPDIFTDRIDIGVFADNGANLSAPAFISVMFPPNQLRTYKDGRIARIDYNAPGRVTRTVDPVLFPVRDWADDYLYATDGAPQGWIRSRKGGKTRFLANGRRVIRADAQGRPLEVEKVRYQAKALGDARQQIEEVGTGEIETLTP